MVNTTFILDVQRTATINAAGTASILQIGPTQPFEKWHIKSTTCTSTSLIQTTLTIYDDAGLTRRREGTYSGNQDTSDTEFLLQSGSSLSYMWSGGTPGAIVTINVHGEKIVQGNRAGYFQ